MTVAVSDLTRKQNDALGEFLSDWGGVRESTLRAAKSFKKCIDLDMDMSRYVSSPSLRTKLLVVAAEKLMPMSQAELLFLPARSVEVLSSLRLPDQERVMKDGVDVLTSSGDVVKKTFAELSMSEVSSVFDVTGGRGRIVSPEEQAKRAIASRQPPARDQIVEVRLNYEEAKEAFSAAHKAGKPLPSLIKALLKKEGVIG